VTPEERALVLEAARILNNLATANVADTMQPYRAVAVGGAQTYQPPGPAWVCPMHGGSRLVPAGISQRTGRAYNAFLACSAPGCDSRPPRNGPVSPVEPRRATNYPEVVPESTRGLTELP
jgi:hypothetical protein